MIRFIFHKAIIKPSAYRANIEAIPIPEHVLAAYGTLMRLFWWTMLVRIIILRIYCDLFLIPLSILIDTLRIFSGFQIVVSSLVIIVLPSAFNALQATDVLPVL